MLRIMNSIKTLGGTLALFSIVACQQQAISAESATVIAPPAVDDPASGTQTAIFAGGCFWGVQGVFQHVKGVSNAVSGYAGGDARSASYEAVERGDTGHAESVRITYDPAQISYGKLLQIFFSVAHDPTQLNRQGPDSGTQYRSAIFPQTPAQQAVAEKYMVQLNASRAFRKPLATRIESGKQFYVAEAYHQNYLTLHPNDPYIVYNDLQKLTDLKRILPAQYRADAVLVRKSL
nr:peptide-methionine (S)-S-oxide reductase MsrA [uncultured Duganella sp.]